MGESGLVSITHNIHTTNQSTGCTTSICVTYQPQNQDVTIYGTHGLAVSGLQLFVTEGTLTVSIPH